MIELAWAAGFWDGEGCTYVAKPHKGRAGDKPYMFMCLGQTDLDPLNRFHVAVGAGNISGPRLVIGRKPIWSWKCYANADVWRVINLLWPYLSEPKRQQIWTKAGEVNQ